MDNIHQANGVHVKHRRRVRIIAELRRIAGDTDQIAQTRAPRAQQVRLHAEHSAVAAGEAQDRFKADFLPNEKAHSHVAPAPRTPPSGGYCSLTPTRRLPLTRTLQL